MYNNNWLTRLNRKFGRYAIHNLMLYIVIGQAIVYAFDFVLSPTGINISGILYFYLPAIKAGQVWRLVSFALIPPGSWLIFAVLFLYFSWLMGSALENEWGAVKFNLFYLTGIVGTVLGGLITQYASNTYIHMSMFLAFALIYPEFEILLFFILPVKVKYLAMVYLVFLAFSLLTASWGGRVAILISVLNLFLFFGPQILERIHLWRRRMQWKSKFK